MPFVFRWHMRHHTWKLPCLVINIEKLANYGGLAQEVKARRSGVRALAAKRKISAVDRENGMKIKNGAW
jgi:hypothetical protein